MFTAFINTFKTVPEDNSAFMKANEALHERMEHMLRQKTLTARIVGLEAKPQTVVKANISIRRTIAA